MLFYLVNECLAFWRSFFRLLNFVLRLSNLVMSMLENFQISAVVAETKYAITDSPDGEASYLNITLDGCT
jgi:hypothetical protein